MPALAHAQEASPKEMAFFFPGSGSFFMTVLAGVLLAFGFQALFTNLSLALGITAAGDLREKMNRPPKGREKLKNSKPLSQRITAGFGLWSVVTASISLFFASWLAVKLSLMPVQSISIALGLVIWAGFYMLMAWLEVRSASAMVGGLTHAAGSAFRSAFGALAPKPESRIEDAARKSASAIREELFQDFDTQGFEKKLNKYLKKLELPSLDPDKLRHEFSKILEGVEIKELREPDQDAQRQFVVHLAEKKPHLSKESVKKITRAFDEARRAAAEQPSAQGKVYAAFESLAPGTAEKAREYEHKIEEYLRSTRLEQLDPQRIKQDIDHIIHEPQSTKQVLMNFLKTLDEGHLVSAIAERHDIDREQLQKAVNTVKSVMSELRHQIEEEPEPFQGNGGNGGKSIRQQAAQSVEETKKHFESKIASFLDSLERPEFDYEDIKADLVEMLHDPKSSIQILRDRLSRYDRNSVVTLLSSNEHISPEQAEKIVSKIEEARRTAIQRAEELEMAVKEKLEDARQTVIEEAERARSAAAAAAWWMFASALISGGAAVAGSMLAI
jgi:hypothetical protein